MSVPAPLKRSLKVPPRHCDADQKPELNPHEARDEALVVPQRIPELSLAEEQ